MTVEKEHSSAREGEPRSDLHHRPVDRGNTQLRETGCASLREDGSHILREDGSKVMKE